MVMVCNKYNPTNFWYVYIHIWMHWCGRGLIGARNGRWRSLWNYDVASHTLSGTMRVQVHYYEDGNVQLNTDKAVTVADVGGSVSGVHSGVGVGGGSGSSSGGTNGDAV